MMLPDIEDRGLVSASSVDMYVTTIRVKTALRYARRLITLLKSRHTHTRKASHIGLRLQSVEKAK